MVGNASTGLAAVLPWAGEVGPATIASGIPAPRTAAKATALVCRERKRIRCVLRCHSSRRRRGLRTACRGASHHTRAHVRRFGELPPVVVATSLCPELSL